VKHYSSLTAKKFTSAAAASFGEYVPVSILVYSMYCQGSVIIQWYLKNLDQLLDKMHFFKQNPKNTLHVDFWE